MPWYRKTNYAYKNDTAPKKTQACICSRDPDVSVPFYYISFSQDSLHTYATCSQKGGTHCFDVGSVIQHRQIHSQITYSVPRHLAGRNPSRRNNNAAGSRASRTNSFPIGPVAIWRAVACSAARTSQSEPCTTFLFFVQVTAY